MQLTSPAFLFLFLPLSLLYLPLCPQKWRKCVLSLFSLVFFLLANLRHPLSLLQIGFVVLVITALSLMPGDTLPRFRLFLGVAVPLALFFTARLLTEIIPAQYEYPFGLGLVTLGAISLSVDRYRGDAPEREGPLDTVGYLLFFPTLTVGPILRYKQYLYMTEHISPSFDAFCAGALRYVIGFLKRVAVATVLFSCLQIILGTEPALFSLPLLLIALVLGFFLFYFAISGTTDMARGLLQIYGLVPPRGQGQVFTSPTPHRMLSHMLLSYDRFLEDYVASPVRRALPGRRGRVLAACLFYLCTVLFYRTHPALLLIMLPMLITALCTAGRGRWKRTLKNRVLRFLFSFLSAVLLALFAVCITLEDPMHVFRLFAAAFTQGNNPLIYQTLVSLTYGRYLLWLLPVAVLLLPLSHFLPRLCRALTPRVQEIARALGTLVCFLAFFFTLLYLFPQFPQYADMTYCRLLQ
ncbi:MAG: hypothetical protein E7624_04900 [Ruminococcaceae bacterium]|nr:hypothetical protein [Oscillospiraceae bacterium]